MEEECRRSICWPLEEEQMRATEVGVDAELTVSNFGGVSTGKMGGEENDHRC